MAVFLHGCGSPDPADGAAPAPNPTSSPGPTADAVAPSAPASVAATASTSSAISVSWSASTDNVGVTGYRLYRCTGSACTPTTLVASPTGTSHLDSGLATGSSYSYRVTAVDAAGNASAPSARASAATLASGTPPVADTTAPTMPASLTATAASSATINLSWTASTDNIGVSGYRVFRCAGASCTPTQQVATSSATGYADNGLSGSSTYGYRVAAVDAAGNVSPQSAVAVATTTAPLPSNGQDFAVRCTAAGVLKCQGFDSAAAVAPVSHPAPGNYPVRAGTATESPIFDASVKSDGGGSLKFIIPGRSGANNGGQWRQDFGRTFGPGTTFYVQFRQRFSTEMLTVNWGSFGGSFKQVIFHNAAATCADVELTTGNYYDTDVPIMYTECGGRGLYTNNGVPPTLLQQGEYNCAYGSINSTNCYMYTANEWLTFYYKVQIGTWGRPASSIEAWVAREGQPFKKWISLSGFTLNNSTPGQDYNYLTLLPYMTGKDASVDHPTAYTWYDELIVSTQPIAPPLGVSSGSAPTP